MRKCLREKRKTLLKKGFFPSPTPTSSFLKLLLLQADSLFRSTRQSILHPCCPFLCLNGTHVTKERNIFFQRFNTPHRNLPPSGFTMSPGAPERGEAAFRPAFTARPSVIPPKYPKISSLLTTVRLLSDRSRPPQVGATAHTCTASADRTALAKTFRAPQSLSLCLSPLPIVFGNAPCSRTPAPPNGEAFGGIRGARGACPDFVGELFPPAGSGAAPRWLLPGLPSTPPGAAPRCSGLSPFLSLSATPVCPSSYSAFLEERCF